jgi:hypothetical protein
LINKALLGFIDTRRGSYRFEVHHYYRKLTQFYSYPDQLVFVDDTSKDGRDSIQKYAWNMRNTTAIVSLSFGRGERVSALVAFSTCV